MPFKARGWCGGREGRRGVFGGSTADALTLGAISMTREGERQKQRLGERVWRGGLRRIKKEVMQKHPHLTRSANTG